MLYSVKINF